MLIYMPHINAVQSNDVTGALYVYTSHYLHVLMTNMFATFHIYVLLHCYWNVLINVTHVTVHVTQKRKCSFNLPCCIHICARNQYSLKCHTYATYANDLCHWQKYVNIFIHHAICHI